MADDGAEPALTDHAELHGCSCKVGRGDLESLLAEAGVDGEQPGLLFGVGEDAAAQPLGDSRALVSTVDVFTPVVDDPADFGRVAAVNAASDAFATGAVDDLACLAVLGLPRDLTTVAAEILTGMLTAIAGMDGVIAGGHTILNPWPLAGGAITATAPRDGLLTTTDVSPGDHLYLTKPLGTQPAMGALRVSDGEFAETVADATDPDIEAVGQEAYRWMVHPNRAAALAVRELATAATDVTGFGLLGEASTIAARSGVGIELTALPVIEGTPSLSDLFGYGLVAGESAETSGGLLVAVEDDRTAALEAALDEADVFYRAVGRVTEGAGARLAKPAIDQIFLGTAPRPD
jgi:selenide,water dikinase